jgi:hypothetical protein
MARKDKGQKRVNYNADLDATGKTGKENTALNNFWKLHKVSDFMTLSKKEADKIIDKWFEKFEAEKLKKNKLWWYPDISKSKFHTSKKKDDLDNFLDDEYN